MRTSRRESGLTMIELIVFIVIISIAVMGILGVMSLTTERSADPLRQKQALMIAESLMEEVQSAGFTYCDPASPNADSATSAAACAIPEGWGRAAPESGDPRPYDNVNDYVSSPGVATAAFGAITDASGAAIPVTGYTATVAIAPATLGGLVGGGGADTAVLRITVTVTYDGKTLALDGYRTRYAPN